MQRMFITQFPYFCLEPVVGVFA